MTKGSTLLKNKRIELGLTQDQLSDKLGIQRSVIANIEANPAYNTSVQTAKVIGDFLKIEWNKFFEEE